MLPRYKKILKILPLILILTGIILRLDQYFYNRSLTEGEAPLAMNIVHRSYSDLLKPLDYVQAAPIGFLYVEKLFVNVLGNHEFSLRIFPLITGILAIFLFFKILKYLGDYKTEIFALCFFIVNDYLIYFSSEVKPYSSDVFFSLILIFLSVIIIQNRLKPSPSRLILWGIIGAISIWFSFPSVFIFCGIGIVFIFFTIKNKNWCALVLLLIAGVMWLLSLGFNYSISLQHLTKYNELINFWQEGFIPLPPKSLHELYLLFYNLLRIFKNPGGFSIYEFLFSILLFFIGLITCWRKNKYHALLFILPVLVTILGSGLHLYPFEGRVLLFITPILFVFVASGITRIYEIVRKNSQIIAILIALILLIQPIGVACYHLIRPRAPEELRTVLEYLQRRKEESDIIYVYYGAVNAFKYYQQKFFEIGNNYIAGTESRTDWTGYYKDIEKLKGNNRVWFLFSHIATHFGVDEEKLFLSYLNHLGNPIESFTTSGASAYLYDLNK